MKIMKNDFRSQKFIAMTALIAIASQFGLSAFANAQPAKPKKPLAQKSDSTILGGFQIDFKKTADTHKAFVITDATPEQIKAKGPLTQMKYAETKSEWKQCADLRNQALKAHENLSGWIWTLAFNCEVKLYDMSYKITASPKSKNKNQLQDLQKQKLTRLKNLVQAFDNHLTSLDRGPWKKDLQTAWMKVLTILKNNAATQAERNQVAEHFYKRPELLTPELEKDLLSNLQEPYDPTRSNQTSSQKTASVVTEPWWEAARRMDYEQVVKILEEYFKKNESPSNFLSAKLLQGKAYLWTGRYDQAKTTFEKIATDFPLTEEGVDAQFRLGLLHLRLGNPQQAQQAFDKLIATNREKNPLTTRYWRLRSIQAQNQTEAYELERQQLIAQFPFTYFGIKLRMEAQQGKLEFPQDEIPQPRQQWNFPKSAQQPWKRFLDLTKHGLLWEAGTEIQDLLSLQDAEAYQAWAEFFAEQKMDALAIRFGQSAQNMDERLTTWAFQKKFMPMPYEKIVQDQALLQKIEPWIIWAITRQESAFNIRATSTSNAYGLMQLIGPTAQEVAQDLRTTITVPDDLYVPEKNIPFGARYLSKMRNEFQGHWPLAVASYNAGPTRLKAWLKLRKDTETLAQNKSTEWRDEIWIDELPWTETQNYVKSVMRNYILYRLGNQSNWTPPPVFWSESDPAVGVSSGRLIEKRSIKR